MNPLALIDKYYPEENELKHILLTHSRSVAGNGPQSSGTESGSGFCRGSSHVA